MADEPDYPFWDGECIMNSTLGQRFCCGFIHLAGFRHRCGECPEWIARTPHTVGSGKFVSKENPETPDATLERSRA